MKKNRTVRACQGSRETGATCALLVTQGNSNLALVTTRVLRARFVLDLQQEAPRSRHACATQVPRAMDLEAVAFVLLENSRERRCAPFSGFVIGLVRRIFWER